MVDEVVRNAELANKFSKFMDYRRRFISQQSAWLNGTPNAVIAGQPSPGYYPFTEPEGPTYWMPCPAKMKADLSNLPILELSGASVYTASALHNKKLVLVRGLANEATVITFPTGLGKGFSAMYVALGDQTSTGFAAGSGMTIRNDQEFYKMLGKFSVATATTTTTTNVVIGGTRLA